MPSTRRISDFAEGEITPEQHQVYEAILAGPRGTVEGPLRIWLHSPGLAERAQELGAFCRYGTSLPRVLSELAILVTGAHWRAGFEWHVHAPIAIQAGLSPDSVEAIRRGETPAFSGDAEAVVYAFTRELLETRRVSAAAYSAAREHLGERGVVELVGILGYYALISMTIIAFEVPVPGGAAAPFDPA
jgi:4-carboxymuconolactone decarboxylase